MVFLLLRPPLFYFIELHGPTGVLVNLSIPPRPSPRLFVLDSFSLPSEVFVKPINSSFSTLLVPSTRTLLLSFSPSRHLPFLPRPFQKATFLSFTFKDPGLEFLPLCALSFLTTLRGLWYTVYAFFPLPCDFAFPQGQFFYLTVTTDDFMRFC